MCRYKPIYSSYGKNTQDIVKLEKNTKKCVDDDKQKYFNRNMVNLSGNFLLTVNPEQSLKGWLR
ncbi:MAG: hypothetical protein PHV17_05520 [Candidatus Omnitrophica bacterium]|nr:hypothetical protein [Candidatus Omnitrophota bacterium]